MEQCKQIYCSPVAFERRTFWKKIWFTNSLLKLFWKEVLFTNRLLKPSWKEILFPNPLLKPYWKQKPFLKDNLEGNIVHQSSFTAFLAGKAFLEGDIVHQFRLRALGKEILFIHRFWKCWKHAQPQWRACHGKLQGLMVTLIVIRRFSGMRDL